MDFFYKTFHLSPLLDETIFFFMACLLRPIIKIVFFTSPLVLPCPGRRMKEDSFRMSASSPLRDRARAKAHNPRSMAESLV